MQHIFWAMLVGLGWLANSDGAGTTGCGELVTLTLPNRAVIASATEIADAPGRCRVSGTIDDAIGFEVNLPAEWNRKLLVVGIGGNAGTITDTSIGWKRHYATATTDTGHRGNGGDTSWALNNPRAERDFAERAFHLTTVTAKEIIRAFYGEAPRKAYFTGCSGGGRQAMIEAQRYPDDFDGIIVGAPAYNLTGFHFTFIWNGRAMFPDPKDLSRPLVSQAKLMLLEAKVLAKCDAVDGLADGLIDDPRRCAFDPAKDLPICPGAEAADCFTTQQAAALRKIYDGPRNARGQLYPGFHPGVESGWNVWLGEGNPGIKPLGPNLSYAFGEGFLRYWIYDDPTYRLHQFDFEKNIPDTAAAARLVNAENPNLRAFQQRGGKIIFYHGWADNAFPAAATIQYYERMQRAMGGVRNVERFARLFLVPGMLHCGGGPGCHQIDYLTALEQWVEQGRAPDRIVGSGTSPARTRPICAYPKTAKYNGGGDVNVAANFRCSENP
ncbi:MAG: tannase/feruloyl esterase family alpha/beta hydrolase [Blastocatellia bacterium]|nr:tannase/feruloyl esterase family alpha/beta hydrolase [Blastocatellia bacterium]